MQDSSYNIFLVCALIPLVPGGGMYRTMLAAIRGDAQQTLNMGLQTLSIAGDFSTWNSIGFHNHACVLSGKKENIYRKK